MVKLGVARADETYRDITKMDVVDSLFVSDVLQRDVPVIQEGVSLKEIIKNVRQHETYNFSVVDKDNRLMGMISLRELKDASLEEDVAEIIRAEDISVQARLVPYETQPFRGIYDFLENRNIDFLPVIDAVGSHKVAGIVERHHLLGIVDRKLLERHQGAEEPGTI